MELISLTDLKELSSYSTKRSIRSWLKAMNVRVIKVGKNYCVSKTEFEQALSQHYELKDVKQITRKTYTPQTESERQFLDSISHLLK